MMTSLFNFKKWLQGWDLTIESLDDREEQEKFEKILTESINFLNNQLSEWEEMTMKQENGNEKLLSLFENKKYKDFHRISGNLLWVRSRVRDLYEIKNRRTFENLKLKGELAEKMKSRN